MDLQPEVRIIAASFSEKPFPLVTGGHRFRLVEQLNELVCVCHNRPARGASMETHSQRCRMKPNRQMCRTMDMQCLAWLPWLVGRQFPIFQSRQEIGKGDLRFHSREGRAETGVDAMAEGNM